MPSLTQDANETSETGKPLHCDGHRHAEIPCGAREVTVERFVTVFQGTPL